MSSHNKLVLTQRVDTSLLLSFVEQGKQKLHTVVNKFGDLGQGQPCRVENDHPAVQAAKHFLMPIVLSYAAGQIEVEDLKKERDKLWQKYVKEHQKGGGHAAKKRPASSEPAAQPSLPPEAGAQPSKAVKTRKPSAAPARPPVVEGSGSKSQPAAKEATGKPSAAAAPAAPARSPSSSSGQHAAMPAISYFSPGAETGPPPDLLQEMQVALANCPAD